MTTDRPWLQDEAVRARLEPVRSLIHWAYEHGYHEMGYPPEDALAEAAYRAGVEAAMNRVRGDLAFAAKLNLLRSAKDYTDVALGAIATLLPPSPERSETE